MREMEARIMKITAAAAVIMICAVAIVGVSYAYTASTENDGNNAASQYVKLSQGGTGNYTFTKDGTTTVYYDTVNTTDSSTYSYRITESQRTAKTVSATDYEVVQLGSSFTIDASSVGSSPSVLNCTFSTLNFNLQTGYVFIVEITGCVDGPKTWISNTDDVWATPSFQMNQTAGDYNAVTVSVYYGYLTSAAPLAQEPVANPLDSAKMTFTATIANAGIQLDKSSIALAGGTATITAKIDGTPTGDVTWTSSDDSKFSVTGDGTKKTVGTVSFEAAGSAIISASVVIDGVTYTATCTVSNE
jgi:hypothetical protein